MDGQSQQTTSIPPATHPITPAVPPAEPVTATQPTASPVVPPLPTSTPASSDSVTSTPPPKKSHTKFLFILLIFLILIIAGLVMYKVYMTKSSESMYQGAYKVSPTVTASPTPTSAAVKSGDAQIDQQSDVIDESMNKLNDDLKNVDQGLTDQSENLN